MDIYWSSGQIAVKSWSNCGQTAADNQRWQWSNLVKRRSKLVNWWSNEMTTTVRQQEAVSEKSRIMVKKWSKSGQKRRRSSWWSNEMITAGAPGRRQEAVSEKSRIMVKKVVKKWSKEAVLKRRPQTAGTVHIHQADIITGQMAVRRGATEKWPSTAGQILVKSNK